MLSAKYKELINKLIELTNNSKIKWERYNRPTAFIYKSKENDFIVDNYNSIVEKNKYNCSELAIRQNGRIYEDLVYCNNDEYAADYKFINELYKTVYKKFNETNDNEIGNILEALPS